MLITEIWARQPGKFFCLATKSGAGKFKEYFFSREEFGQIRRFLKDNQDLNIYFCPHGFNRRVRQKEEAVMPNLLWADLDFADPSDMRPRPTIAIESSPGRFVGLWETKETVTEELNRRLTHHVEADPGGWDVTQLLRCPGTRNYKYSTQPRVRVLWDDGRIYSLKQIEKFLPPAEEEEEGEHLSAAEVYQAYENRLPRWARKELLARKIVGRADRSEMLWKLENACVEAGMSLDEAFAVIRKSAWNKFAGRRNEETQLKRELSKIIDLHFREKPKGAEKLHRKADIDESREEKEPRGLFKFVPMSEIQEEEIDWLWYPYLARKTLSILEGDPGQGKSYMAMMVAGAIATDGMTLPCKKKGKKIGHGPVVYFDIENNAASVTKVRLKYNGFDNLNNYYAVEQAFSIEDMDAIEEIYEYLEQIKPALVVFDTLNTYIGKADTHKASEATQAMNMFKQIADDFNCAVLVLRHLTKSTGSAINRGQGSIAFAGSARVVMVVGLDPEDTETRVMAIVKGNLAPLPGGLAFRIEGRKKDRSEFIWDGFNELTAQQVLDASGAARAEGKQGTGIQDAMEFLEATITGAPHALSRLLKMAERRSIAAKMVERAASKMNVVKETKKVDGRKIELWHIPRNRDEDDEE